VNVTNYYPDVNRFHLAGPPVWFLAKLWEFDPSLVIVPSRQGFCYRLAQRRMLTLAEHVVNDALFKDSDTQMLASYSLIPVTSILATCNWSNPYLFVELANRAPWRQGGADAVNARLDAHDADVDAQKRDATDQHLSSLSTDAWQQYRNRIGLGRTIFLPNPGRPRPVQGRDEEAAVKAIRPLTA